MAKQMCDVKMRLTSSKRILAMTLTAMHEEWQVSVLDICSSQGIVCKDPTPMHCNSVHTKCMPYSSLLLCNTDRQHSCVTAITPMHICCPYRYVMTQQQCNPTLFRHAVLLTAAVQN